MQKDRQCQRPLIEPTKETWYHIREWFK